MTRFHDVSNNESYHIRMLHALHDRDLLSELLRHAVRLEHTLECDRNSKPSQPRCDSSVHRAPRQPLSGMEDSDH